MATTRIPTYPADVVYETALNIGPLAAFPPPLWTNFTNRVLGPWSTSHGADYLLGRTTAGTWKPVLDNRDGGLDPFNASGPYYPNLAPYKQVRIRMPFGVNQLTADQAGAGEQSGYLGALPVQLGIVNDAGYPLSIVASGSAFQGAQVYQAVLPTGATVGATILLLKQAAVIPKQTYSFQAQARITAGNSVATQVSVAWIDLNGNTISTAAGTAQSITSGSSTWIQLAAAGLQAPAGAYSAQLKVQIASGTLTGSTTWQVDGLQWEQSPVATVWQLPGTLGANLLPQAVATGSASIDPTADSAANHFASAVGSIAQATNLTAAPTGASTAVAWTSPSGTTNTSPLYCGAVLPLAPAIDGPVTDCVQVTAGQQYTASTYLMRVSSADAIQVQVSIKFFTASGAPAGTFSGSSASVASGSWVRASVTATAPAGAAWGRPSYAITSPVGTTVTNTIYCTSWQFEQAASASAWVDPGPTYYPYWGYWEQFPQKWRLSGVWGETDAVCTDVLAGLAQRQIKDPFVEEVLATGVGPDFFYALGDPAGSTSCADTAGKRVPCPVENSPYGAGSLALGSAVTSASPGQAFKGATGTIATLNNNPSQGNSHEAQTYLALHETTLTPGPPSPQLTGGTLLNPAWTRMIAFRAPSAPASGNFPTLWMAQAPTFSSDLSFYLLYVNPTTGTLSFQENSSGGTGPLFTSAASVCDGNWHLVAFSFSGNGGFFDVFLDGTRVFHDNNSGAGWGGLTSIATDVVGANVVVGRNAYVSGWVGDLAHLVQFPFALSTTQATNLYNSWRSASSGESTGTRAQRLATWVGYPGAVAFDSGSTQSMGPANDLTGQSALAGYGAIAATENGDVFASNSNTLTFKSRAARYNSTPVFVFGEGAALGHPGEWPAEDMQLPTDPLNTYNIVPTQQYSTGQIATAQDAASQQANWQRTASTIVVNASSFAEVQAAGQYQLGRLKIPRQRLASMTLHPSAMPGLARVCAQLEKGVRIRAMKRPPFRSGASPIQFDGFVERVEWSRDPSGELFVRVEASPADLTNYLVLAPLHTTLNAQAASGQNQATINALSDAFVNPLAASLPQGYQLTFEPGTPRAETLTLAPSGIPFTGVGYQSAVLTFTTNFQFTHPANSVVTEPLPQGYTDPTLWDGQPSLAASSTTVLSGGASGTNTVTVGPLADSAANPLGSTWNVGDLLWLSPNNPAVFEGYNRLHPNLATAGEGALPLAAGTFGYTVGLFTAYNGNALQVTAAGTAWQGANVWQVTVPGAAGTGQDLASVLKMQCAAGLAFTGSFYVRSATTGANPQVQPYIQWYDAYYNPVGVTTTGTTVTLTGSPTAAWTRVTASATAPAGAVYARIGVTLTSAPAGSWAFQCDGLQFEQANAASVFCTTPQIKSVGATMPGYGSCVITLNTNLLNTHAAGDTVCDPLPPGVTSPPASPARLAY